MRIRKLAIVVVLSLAVIGLAAWTHQPAPLQSTNVFAGLWAGKWWTLSPSSQGYLYDAVMSLESDASNAVKGRITWRLVKSPRSYEQAKLGLTAVEIVKGTYNPTTRILKFAGYAKEDPDSIIGLDQYQLFFADNNTVIGGITESNGTWQGLFSVKKQD